MKNHELEKQNALQDFEAYKIRAIDIAQRTTRDYQTKFELQADSIVKINLGYQEKLSTFELCNKDLSNSLESLKTNGRLHLDEVRKRFDSEKLDLNSSMNRMMERNQAEHIKLQGSLRLCI